MTCAEGQAVGQKGHSPGKYTSELVGTPNEMKISINGVATPALLDMGFAVSTISKSFYTAHFSSIGIQCITHNITN